VLLYSAKERFDVEHSIDLLTKSSLIEALESAGDEAEFLSVPLTGSRPQSVVSGFAVLRCGESAM
jgi:hypothetical protein